MICALLNVRSLISNFIELRDTLELYSFDLLALTETWLRDDPDESIFIDGYRFVRNDRLTRGGGTGIYIKDGINYEIVNFDLKLENTSILVTVNKVKILYCVIYKPPKVENRVNLQLLLDDIEDVMLRSVAIVDKVILLGDMNVDFLKL